MTEFVRLLQDEEAATAIEYGLIVGLLAIAIIVGMNLFAGEAISMWNMIADRLQGAMS